DKPERDTRTTRGELDLVDAAKRKFAQAEELDVAAFRVRGLAILDSALSIDPDNGKAWLLKAELSEDVKGSLVALNKARAASADADEVEKIEKSLKADFDKELVSIVKKNDLDLLTEGIKAGFVNGESKINDQTLTEYALERDNARMLGRLMSAAGDSPTARKSSRKMAQALIFPAVAGKKMKTIQLMVDQGAKVDVSNEKGDTPLSLAAKNSDKKVMRLLLDNAGKRTDASAALQIAAQKNEYELMEMILKSKATAKPVDAEGNTLLMKAIADEDNRLFDLLLDNKADVNAANKEGETPLSLAAKAGNESQILRLVEAGSDLEKAFEQLDKDDARALAGQLFSAAIERENEDLIEACLEYDEDLPYREHRSGVSYLTYALDDDKWDLAATMLEATTLSGINKPMDGEYYLLRAVRKEALPVLRVLVSQPQTDMNVQNDDGQSALHMAVEKGNVDLVNLILKGKPELEPRDRAGDTPMHIAIREDQDQIVDALLEMDQRYNASNRRGQTPLHLAIARDKDDIAETLIRSGVDVNASDSNGRTPLHIAVLERNQQMARLLLQNEAIPDAKDVLNRTPLKIARQNKDKAMSAIIREYAPTIFDKVQFWKNEEP
ncbi:MAG: ankyrin repeat domain-containing protein, partial [Bacteroidota bacterium]